MAIVEKINNYEGICCYCGLKVEARDGIVFKTDTDVRWRTRHDHCYPGTGASAPPKPPPPPPPPRPPPPFGGSGKTASLDEEERPQAAARPSPPPPSEREEPRISLLIRLLNMTTSSTDAEALVAIRKANELIQKTGWDWEALLMSKVTVVEDPFNSIANVPNQRYKPAPPTPSQRYTPPPPPPPRPQAPPRPRPSPTSPRPAPRPQPTPQPAQQAAAPFSIKPKGPRPTLDDLDDMLNRP